MAPAAGQLSLPRSRKIKLGRDFTRIRSGGRRLACGCVLLNWLALPPETPSRLGVVASKKLGGATVRNRSKRLLREAFRLNQPQLAKPADVVLVARQSIVGKDFAGVERDVLGALRQAHLLQPTS